METAAVRLLKAEEIECRVSTINEKGLSLLLFKDARVDQKILDETFTPFGWKRSHQMLDGNLYCTVEIWDGEKQQWIGKQDVGTTSYTEKEKGQASDSFKRACFNWGVGRELYTAPFIWLGADQVEIRKKNDRYCTSERFSVRDIGYSGEREITSLVIANGRGHVVYRMGKKADSGPEGGTEVSSQQIRELKKELERTGVPLRNVLDRYRITDLDQMTEETYRNAMSGLKKSRNRDVA
ncbi:MAG: hypothetical protein HFG63_04470 [Lachnospiraceae bacterium]|nr:hypothetical protein [Lachnospiraceae bacterium]